MPTLPTLGWREAAEMKKARSCLGCLRTNSLTLATIVGVVTGFIIGVRTLIRYPADLSTLDRVDAGNHATFC